MRRYLLDTGIAGHYLNRKRGVYQRARVEAASGNKIGIGLPVLGELWDGLANSASAGRNRQLLLRALADWTRWPFTEAAAEEYGRLSTALRHQGRPMQQIDIQIAAIALSLGNTIVVSADSDLSAVPGLPVENWATP